MEHKQSCVWLYGQVEVRGQSVIIVGSQELSVLVFEAGSLMVSGAHRLGSAVCLASQGILLYLPNTGISSMCHHVQLGFRWVLTLAQQALPQLTFVPHPINPFSKSTVCFFLCKCYG